MPEFIINYWVQWLFGLVVAGGGILAKRYIDLEKKDRELKRQELLKEVDKKVEEEHNKSHSDDLVLQEEINLLIKSMDCLKKGLLSVQGRDFKKACEKALELDHIIDLEEYQQLSRDHEAYNGLGGNHNGDHLFNLVEKKYEHYVTETHIKEKEGKTTED